MPVSTVTPEYPKKALKRKQQGHVVLAYKVDTRGNAIDIHVVSSQPDRVFDSTVVQALQVSRFKPASVNGIPVTTPETQTSYQFRILPHEAMRSHRQDSTETRISFFDSG